MHFDKAYIIGLPNHTNKRLDRCFKRFKREKVDVELWPGLYGPDINIQEYQDKGYLSKDFTLKMPGSLGCMLSHITLWEHLEKNPECNIALICEDDILLKNNFLKNLHSIPWADVPEDWEMIKLSYHRLEGENISSNIIKPSLNNNKGINSGMFCYLLNVSKNEKIKNIILPYNNQQSWDAILRNNFNKFHIYLTSKVLATEERYRYSIRKDLNFSARKISIFEKLFMKISRLFLS